jgi:predicted anti-sigma-YlaC factor YlaD
MREGEPAPCDAVRLSISARLDGETPDISVTQIGAHLAGCPDCRRFETAASTLAGETWLQTTRPVPGALKDVLAAELVRAVGPAPRRWSRPTLRLTTTFGWRRGIQWAGAVVPAAAVTIVISLGVLPNAGGQPTHPSTPCTVHLRSHHTATDRAYSRPGYWLESGSGAAPLGLRPGLHDTVEVMSQVDG